MEQIAIAQQQLELDKRAFELDRKASQLDFDKKQVEQQKVDLEQRAQSIELQQQRRKLEIKQREDLFNEKFNQFQAYLREQTLVQLSSTPPPPQFQQEHNQQVKQPHSHSTIDVPSPTTFHPFKLDNVIDTYNDHLTVFAQALKSTAKQLTKKERRLNERLDHLMTREDDVGCDKCQQIEGLDQCQTNLDSREVGLDQREQILKEGEEELLQHPQSTQSLFISDHKKIITCLEYIQSTGAVG